MELEKKLAHSGLKITTIHELSQDLVHRILIDCVNVRKKTVLLVRAVEVDGVIGVPFLAQNIALHNPLELYGPRRFPISASDAAAKSNHHRLQFFGLVGGNSLLIHGEQ